MRDETDRESIEFAETSDRFLAIESIRERLIEGCSEEEFATLYCPVCGAVLSINVHQNHSTFHVRCTRDGTHVSFHDRSDCKPAWWVAHMRGGWY
ncbi:MAG: hypothetical protein WD851_24255 [Pirellulales bacterium]